MCSLNSGIVLTGYNATGIYGVEINSDTSYCIQVGHIVYGVVTINVAQSINANNFMITGLPSAKISPSGVVFILSFNTGISYNGFISDGAVYSSEHIPAGTYSASFMYIVGG